jgi:hypothetical protein
MNQIAEVQMTLTRPDARKLERTRQRYFAAALIDALRGRDEDAVVVNIGDAEDELSRGSKKSATFIVRGAHKPSKWALGEPALFFSPQYADAHAYAVTLKEGDFYRVRDRLVLKGWACGKEHFNTNLKIRHPKRPYACEMCELLHGWASVYQREGDDMVRNRAAITREQAVIADLLLEAAKVSVITPSLN